MKPIKISIIGAGSGCFSLGMIKDICLNKNLQGSTISFMDIDQSRLDAVHMLCTRYADELGVKLTLEKTTDRRESLKGADFVVTTALAASHDKLKDGYRIALKHGFRFPGSYHILYDEAFWVNFYQLKLMESIVQDMLEICPDAWHLMVMNPVVAGTTYLLRKYPKLKMVGLCHGYAEVNGLAEGLGVDKETMHYEMAGVNHFVWLTSLFGNGECKLDELMEKAKGSDDPRQKTFRDMGVHPIGDTAGWTGALWPWWNNMQDSSIDYWKDDLNDFDHGWDSYFNYVHKAAEDIKVQAFDKSVKLTELYPPEATDEFIVTLIESIACDIPRQFIVNILNTHNYVPGIPTDFQVEVPAICSKRGVQGLPTRGLPKPLILHTIRDRVVPVEMELEAYEKGDKELLLQVILMDRWCTSREQATAFLDEILALPYHEEMRKHYK